MGRKKAAEGESSGPGEEGTELKRLSALKDKIMFRKSGKAPKQEAKTKSAPDGESKELTEKLKAAFHEKPKEDKALQQRKDLDETIRGFRKSFRKDVTSEVRHRVDGVVTEVRQSITTIKEVSRTKKKEKDEEEPSDSLDA